MTADLVRENCDQIAGYRSRLERLLAEPSSAQGGMAPRPADAPLPGNPQAFSALMVIWEAVPRLEAALKLAVAGHPGLRRGGSAGNFLDALAAIPDLAAGTDEDGEAAAAPASAPAPGTRRKAMADDPIVAFMRARLDEDERELVKDPPTGLGYANLPARMRRETEIMREILTAYIKIDADGYRDSGWIFSRFAVETLAAIWRDHPDYRPEWALPHLRGCSRLRLAPGNS